MAIEEFIQIIDLLQDSFDSHAFICEYIIHFPTPYGKLLIKHNNVTTAHAEIANFLRNYSNELNIYKTGDSESADIFGKITPCAKWQKII
ncbi:MAG: hypothetical protein ACI3ZX_01230 [Candidatus Aphodosoma sp.]